MLEFVLPAEQNREDVLSFYEEIEKAVGNASESRITKTMTSG